MGLLQKATKNEKSPGTVQEAPHRGFLERADSIRASNEIEQLCIERITRLPTAAGTLYTALTILKAYFPITAEVLLKKRETEYQVLESVGFCDAGCTDAFSLDVFETPLLTYGYRVLPLSVLNSDTLTEENRVFAFPIPHLDGTIIGQLLIAAKDLDASMLSSIQRILAACSKKFLAANAMQTVQPKTAPRVSGVSPETAAENGIQALGESHILVFRFSASVPDEAKETVRQNAPSRLGLSGVSFPVSNDLLVVFIKQTLDRELYAHQLSRSLGNIRSLSADDFQLVSQGTAADTDQAIALIRASQ